MDRNEAMIKYNRAMNDAERDLHFALIDCEANYRKAVAQAHARCQQAQDDAWDELCRVLEDIER